MRTTLDTVAASNLLAQHEANGYQNGNAKKQAKVRDCYKYSGRPKDGANLQPWMVMLFDLLLPYGRQYLYLARSTTKTIKTDTATAKQRPMLAFYQH